MESWRLAVTEKTRSMKANIKMKARTKLLAEGGSGTPGALQKPSSPTKYVFGRPLAPCSRPRSASVLAKYIVKYGYSYSWMNGAKCSELKELRFSFGRCRG